MISRVAIYRGCPKLGHRVGRGDLSPNTGRTLAAKAWRSQKVCAQVQVVVGVHVDAREDLVVIAVQRLVTACMPEVD